MRIESKAQLEHFVSENWEMLNRFLDEWQGQLTQPIYSSVDVRESADKYAPVDHNLYPAGFNNICQKDLKRASAAFRLYLDRHASGAKRVALIPESHTKNKWYLDNVHYLTETLRAAEIVVDVVSPDHSLFTEGHSLALESQSGHAVQLQEVSLRNGSLVNLTLPSLTYDAIILNHDQSVPLPLQWSELTVPVFPSPFAGWTRRQKIHHFQHYKKVADEFCTHFDINPALIQARFHAVEGVDFETKEGLDKLAQAVSELLSELPPDSTVFAKASQGTYGMGISVFKHPEEVLSMNRRTRNKMDVGKNNLKFTSILLQEGVETIVKVESAPAEITSYLVGGRAIGGFMRYNPERGTNANLNSQGMLYKKFCFSDICQGTDTHIKEAMYSLISRLSVLAASYELQDMQRGAHEKK